MSQEENNPNLDLPLDNPKNPRFWSNPDNISKYTVGSYKDNSAIDEKLPSTCQNPPPVTLDDVFTKADEIAKSMGGNSECVKNSKTFANQQSSSDSSYSEKHFDAAVNVDAMIASANASIKMGSADAYSSQDSASQMGQENSQSGCGSLLITANNIAFKQTQMQCAITNNKIENNRTLSSNASVTIRSTPLDDVANRIVSQMNSDLLGMIEKNTNNMFTLSETLTTKMLMIMDKNNSRVPPPAKPMTIEDVIKLVEASLLPMKDFLEKQIEIVRKNIQTFAERRIIMTGSSIMAKAGANVSTFDTFEEETQVKLETLSKSIQKDSTEQQIANDLGVSVMDPQVKSLASTSSSLQSSSASSAIKNTINSSKISMSASGAILIECPGVIEIKDSVIEANAILELISETMVKQSVTTGQSAASELASDSVKGQAIQNKVKGIEELQKALGDTIAGAIGAAGKVTSDAIDADVKKTTEREKSFRAALPGGQSSMVVIAVVAIVVLYLFFGGKGGGAGGGGGAPVIISRMKPFRFN